MGYDLNGRVIQASHPTAPISFVYDDRGLLVSQTGGAGDTTTTYDTAGRPVTQSDEAGTREYDYEATTGLIESVSDGSTGGGGGGAGLDILMIVGNDTSLYNNETAIKNHLESEGHTVTIRDNQAAELTDPNLIGDLVLIAHGGWLGNKYEDVDVPTINLSVNRWDDHELTTGNSPGTTQLTDIDITDPSHPLAGGYRALSRR